MFWSAGKRRLEPAGDAASQSLPDRPVELSPPSPEPIHSWARPTAFAMVVLAGALLLWIALGPHDVADYHAESDFLGGYAEGARSVQMGHLDPARYQVVGPVYEIAIALVGFVTRDLSLAGKLVSVTAACGSLLLWFLLLERRSGPVAGLWTLAFLAVNPVFVRYGSSMTTDMLATLVQAAALFALFGRHGRRAPLWAGVLTGVAVLTRYNAIYLVPAVLVSDAWRSPAGAGSRLRTGVRFAAGFAAVTLPWIAFSLASHQVPGRALFHNVAFDTFGRAQGITWDEYETRLNPLFGSLWDVVARDPAGVTHRWFENLHHHAVLDTARLLGRPAAAWCAAGLALSLADGGWRRLLPLWATGALLYATLVPAFYSERYSLPLAPIYLGLAGWAVASPLLALSIRRRRVPLKWALALWPLAASASGSVADERQLFRDLPREVRPAAAALRAVAAPSSRVLARKPHIGFYSGLTQVPFPTVGTLPELADFCAEERIEFIFFSLPEVVLRPEFTYLLDRDADVPGLAPIQFQAAQPARLYRIEPGFGAAPTWFADDSSRTLRVSRALRSVQAPAWRAELVSGLLALEQSDFRPAARHFAALTRIRPDFAQGFFLAGEAHLQLREFEAAADAYERASAFNPSPPDARLKLGWARFLGGDPVAAADAWRPLVDTVDDEATLRVMQKVFDRVRDLESARKATDRISRRFPPGGAGR